MFLYTIPAKQKRLTKKEYEYITSGQNTENADEQKIKVKWGKLFSLPQTWAFIAGKGLIDPIFWFFLFWLPSYFSATFDLDLTKPSLELMIVYGATTVGSIGGGYFSSWLIRRGLFLYSSLMIYGLP